MWDSNVDLAKHLYVFTALLAASFLKRHYGRLNSSAEKTEESLN
jgi:hypothetical protein